MAIFKNQLMFAFLYLPLSCLRRLTYWFVVSYIEYTEERVDKTLLIISHTVMCHQIIITDRALIFITVNK